MFLPEADFISHTTMAVTTICFADSYLISLCYIISSGDYRFFREQLREHTTINCATGHACAYRLKISR